MKRGFRPILFAVVTAGVISLTLPAAAEACTRVLWNDNGIAVLVSRSMDWVGSSKPRLTVLPRGMERRGGVFLGKPVVSVNPATWTSRHGSLVVTAMNAGTSDGMNERGLGVHGLWLNATDYGPRDPSRAGVQATLWTQYVLDNAATVDEAIALQSRIQPIDVALTADNGAQVRVPLALAVEDASGDSAIMQYINGELIIHHGPEYRVLANDPPYDEALAELAKYDFTNATRNVPLPGNTNSLDRFIRANFYSEFLRKTQPRTNRVAVASLLSVARNVSDPIGAPYDVPGAIDETDYRTVADLTNRIYYFELSRGLALLRTDLKQLDFSKGAPVLELNPQNPRLEGNVTSDYGKPHVPPFGGA
jgi:penicillin V acylase-like amidase (Ntn superfamily)